MENKMSYLNSLNYILIGFSFIVVAFLFYRIIKKQIINSKKRILILKLCLIILFILGCGIIIFGFIPEKISWEKGDENWYFCNDGIKQINMITNEDMSFNFEDFISYQDNVLSSKGYLVEVLKISKFQELMVNRYINSYYRDTNSSNTFILFTVTKKKNKTEQNIYTGKISKDKKNIHTYYLSATLKSE